MKKITHRCLALFLFVVFLLGLALPAIAQQTGQRSSSVLGSGPAPVAGIGGGGAIYVYGNGGLDTTQSVFIASSFNGSSVPLFPVITTIGFAGTNAAAVLSLYQTTNAPITLGATNGVVGNTNIFLSAAEVANQSGIATNIAANTIGIIRHAQDDSYERVKIVSTSTTNIVVKVCATPCVAGDQFWPCALVGQYFPGATTNFLRNAGGEFVGAFAGRPLLIEMQYGNLTYIGGFYARPQQ